MIYTVHPKPIRMILSLMILENMNSKDIVNPKYKNIYHLVLDFFNLDVTLIFAGVTCENRKHRLTSGVFRFFCRQLILMVI